MRSLQRAQQLLLSQTQTVSRLEKELQTQKEHYQVRGTSRTDAFAVGIIPFNNYRVNLRQK